MAGDYRKMSHSEPNQVNGVRESTPVLAKQLNVHANAPIYYILAEFASIFMGTGCDLVFHNGNEMWDVKSQPRTRYLLNVTFVTTGLQPSISSVWRQLKNEMFESQLNRISGARADALGGYEWVWKSIWLIGNCHNSNDKTIMWYVSQEWFRPARLNHINTSFWESKN